MSVVESMLHFNNWLDSGTGACLEYLLKNGMVLNMSRLWH
jgi:hypothetical protein